eukprot:CAMPEP_0197628390 /NCGR_PEP_ID=MMETSP1338-20131121/6721_1 /TAXON_ID=43686 ORGANISM="Pelagodinium beii, Strain RCC1491" /NCGR_SAMPLE_ID=MMETSP1338 /ASSEMBLY_ACC=CAM_ASM_000754 /LENGTH=776 /DNA_ID=CAMNT_0043199357 /DNA_START=46 /DNA_END=2376 /DNA_ORIENTATION=+
MLSEPPKPPRAGDGLAIDLANEEGKAVEALLESERLFEADRYEESLQLATQALDEFRQSKNAKGVAASLRLCIHNFRAQGKLNFAAEMAKEEQLVFEKSGDDAGKAKMLLSQAELALERRPLEESSIGEAETLAKKARELFQELDEPIWEGLATLVLASAALRAGTRIMAEAANNLTCDALECFQDNQDNRNLGRAVLCLAEAQAALQDFREVRRAAEKAVEVFRFAKEQRWEAFALLRKASWHLQEDDAKQALECGKAAAALMQQCSMEDEVHLSRTLATAHLAVGQPQDALTAIRGCLGRARSCGDRSTEGHMFFAAIQAHQAAQDLEGALRCTNEALQIFEELGERQMVPAVLRARSKIEMSGAKQGSKIPKAVTSVQEAIAAAEQLDSQEELAFAWLQLAEIQMAQKDKTEALEATANSVKCLRDAGKRKQEAEANLTAAALFLKQQDYETAGECSFQARRLFQELGDIKGEAEALLLLASAQIFLKDFTRARRVAEMAAELFEKLRDLRGQAESLVLVGQACQQQCVQQEGDNNFLSAYGPAIYAAREAATLAQEIQDKTILASAMLTMSQLQVLQESSLQDAVESATEAAELYAEVGDANGCGASLMAQGMAERGLGDTDEAVLTLQRAREIYRRVQNQRGVKLCDERVTKWNNKAKLANLAPVQAKQEVSEKSEQPAKKREPKEKKDTSGLAGTELIMAQIAQIVEDLGVDDIEMDEGLMSAGINSRTAMMLRQELSNTFGSIKFPATLAFDSPNIRSMTEFVKSQLPG